MRVFDAAWVKDIEQRYERFPPNQRPIIYAIAVHEDRQPFRAEIEAWVGALSSTAKAKIIPRLRSPENIQQSYNELAVGHVFRELGYDLEYEKPFGDLTPDWFVSSKGAEPAFVVETFTANPPKSRTDDLKRLDHLLGRIHEIPVGVELNIRTNLPETPKERESKEVKKEVERWLTSGSPAVGERLRGCVNRECVYT
jgi:hypothetical protein